MFVKRFSNLIQNFINFQIYFIIFLNIDIRRGIDNNYTYAYNCCQYIFHSRRTLDQIRIVANTLNLGTYFHRHSPSSRHMILELYGKNDFSKN